MLIAAAEIFSTGYYYIDRRRAAVATTTTGTDGHAMTSAGRGDDPHGCCADQTAGLSCPPERDGCTIDRPDRRSNRGPFGPARCRPIYRGAFGRAFHVDLHAFHGRSFIKGSDRVT